jgi:type IV pilus assembly protein PilQ
MAVGQTPIQRAEEVIIQAEDRVEDSDEVLNSKPAQSGSSGSQVVDLIDFGDGGSSGGTSLLQADETITIDFPDEEIRAVLRNVADLYELNLVIPDTLVGRTSVKLREVTWEQVFSVVLSPVGYTYMKDENIIKVISREELAMEPTETRVFLINFARAEDIHKTIEPLVSPEIGGRVQVDVRSNALVITERPSRMDKIQDIIDRLDKPTDQIMIESKFIEASDRDLSNIGINWASLNGYGVQAGPFTQSNTSTYGRSNDFNASNGVSNTNSNTASNGTSLNNQTVIDNLTGLPVNNRSTSTTNIMNDVVSDGVTTGSFLNGVTNGGGFDRMTTSVLSADQFQVVLSALKTEADVKLVSNPTVVTLNDSEATINIGEDYPIPKFTYNEERGTFEISDIEYKSIGINLAVTPQVNSAGFINLDIAPEVSARAGTVPLGGASGTEVPIISTRKTATKITIKDGYTLAIGGLIESTETKEISKVPVLGDIPGLGRLFRSNSDSLTQRNLIIFITAKTLNPDGSSYEEVIDPRMLHDMDIRAEDIPGYELSERERELLEAVEQYRNQVTDIENQMSLQKQLGDLKSLESRREKEREASEITGEADSRPFILKRR